MLFWAQFLGWGRSPTEAVSEHLVACGLRHTLTLLELESSWGSCGAPTWGLCAVLGPASASLGGLVFLRPISSEAIRVSQAEAQGLTVGRVTGCQHFLEGGCGCFAS